MIRRHNSDFKNILSHTHTPPPPQKNPLSCMHYFAARQQGQRTQTQTDSTQLQGQLYPQYKVMSHLSIQESILKLPETPTITQKPPSLQWHFNQSTLFLLLLLSQLDLWGAPFVVRFLRIDCFSSEPGIANKKKKKRKRKFLGGYGVMPPTSSRFWKSRLKSVECEAFWRQIWRNLAQ